MNNYDILNEQITEAIEILTEITDLAKYGVYVLEKSVFNFELNEKELAFEQDLKKQIKAFSLIKDIEYQKEVLPAKGMLMFENNAPEMMERIKKFKKNHQEMIATDKKFYNYINSLRRNHYSDELEAEFAKYEEVYKAVVIGETQKNLKEINDFIVEYKILYEKQSGVKSVYSLNAFAEMIENAKEINLLIMKYNQILQRKIKVMVEDEGAEQNEKIKLVSVQLLEIANNKNYLQDLGVESEEVMVLFQGIDNLQLFPKVDLDILKKYCFIAVNWFNHIQNFNLLLTGSTNSHIRLTKEVVKVGKLYADFIENQKKVITRDLLKLYKTYEQETSVMNNFFMNSYTQFDSMGEAYITDLERMKWLVENSQMNVSSLTTNIPVAVLITLAETISYYLCENDYLNDEEIIEDVFEKMNLKYGVNAKMVRHSSEAKYWYFKDEKTNLQGFSCEFEEEKEIVHIYYLPVIEHMSFEAKKQHYANALAVASYFAKEIFRIVKSAGYNLTLVGHNVCGNIVQYLGNDLKINSLSVIPDKELNDLFLDFKYENNIIIENKNSITQKELAKELTNDISKRSGQKNIYVVKEGFENFIGQPSYLTGETLRLENIDYNFIGTEFGDLESEIDYLVIPLTYD